LRVSKVVFIGRREEGMGVNNGCLRGLLRDLSLCLLS
jgi:hypothetical protein